jgi:siroheme synthase
MSPGFVVLSAVPSDGYEKVLSHLPPGAITVVLLMAMGVRAKIAGFLAAASWPSTLPAAIVLGASTPRAWSWTGTLGELGSAEIPADRADLPGLVVLGPVVSLADTVRRAMSAPLRVSSST